MYLYTLYFIFVKQNTYSLVPLGLYVYEKYLKEQFSNTIGISLRLHVKDLRNTRFNLGMPSYPASIQNCEHRTSGYKSLTISKGVH